MARKRMIDPEIWSDPGFLELSMMARLLFIGLISTADDEGKGTGSAKGLKSRIFPVDPVTLADIEKIKEELQRFMRVIFYKPQGQEYYKLLKWEYHQTVPKKQKSHIPEPNVAQIAEPAGRPAGQPVVQMDLEEKVITTDDVMGIDTHDVTEPLPYQLSKDAEPLPNQYGSVTEPLPYQLSKDAEPLPNQYGSVTDQRKKERKKEIQQPSAAATGPPLKIHKKPTKTTTTTTGPPDESPDPEKDKSPPLTAFDLFCRISDWIANTDGLYEPIEKPVDGSKEWGFLKRMAKKFEGVNPDDFVCEVLEMLHQKDKLRKGFINSWIAEEIETCIDDIKREQKSWD